MDATANREALNRYKAIEGLPEKFSPRIGFHQQFMTGALDAHHAAIGQPTAKTILGAETHDLIFGGGDHQERQL